MPRLLLTFDDGPGPSTVKLLDVLARHGARATFFLTGRNLSGGSLGGDASLAEFIALRALAEGHRLGNHTLTHDRGQSSLGEFVSEVRAMDLRLGALHDGAGLRPPEKYVFRLPYGPLIRDGGVMDERLSYLTAMGRVHTHWTGIFDDWEPETTAEGLFPRLLSHVLSHWVLGLTPVLCLHDAGTRARVNGYDRGATVGAVDRLCEALRGDGADYVLA